MTKSEENIEGMRYTYKGGPKGLEEPPLMPTYDFSDAQTQRRHIIELLELLMKQLFEERGKAS